jgi:thymidine phosphorylase
VSRIDTRRVGLAVVVLGGGRSRPDDRVDHAVGLTDLVPVATHVAVGEPLAVVHARTADAGAQAVAMVQGAYRIGGRAPGLRPVVAERVAETA